MTVKRRNELGVDVTYCLNGWAATERWPSCNYTGGHYCERERDHKGRCSCVCGSSSERGET